MNEEATKTGSIAKVGQGDEVEFSREVEFHRALLKQIHGMYDNPELKRVCQDALKGSWQSAFYEKYKPANLGKKTKK